MVAIAVLLTLAVCLLVDWWLQRRAVPGVLPVPIEPARDLSLGPPRLAGGFEWREDVAYHPGHTWALAEGPGRARVGIDDFACRLLGRIDRLELPRPGTRLRQGARVWTLRRDQRRAPMLSPVNGVVVEVNERALGDPAVVARDPYNDGWLLTVRAPELGSDLNNLLSGAVVGRWLEGESAQLRSWLHPDAPLSFADGGPAADDIGQLIPDSRWRQVAQRLLRADPGEV